MTETVALSTSVDVTEASNEQVAMYEEMAGIFEEMFEMFVDKNMDYGSSFLTAGEIDRLLSDHGGGPFDSALESNLYKVFTRIQDKDQRFYSQTFGDGSDRVGEGADETAADAAVYWLMIVWLLRHGD